MTLANTFSAEIEELLNFLYQVPIAILRIAATGKIELANPRAIALLAPFSLPMQPMDGWQLLENFSPKAAQATREALGFISTPVDNLEIILEDNKGNVEYFELTVVLISSDAFMLTLKEISARVKAEIKLCNSEKKYRELLSFLPTGIVVHGSSAEITYANDEASRLLGLTSEQLLGIVTTDPLLNLKHENGTITRIDNYPLSCVLSSGKPVTEIIIEIVRPNDDKSVWVICSALPILNEQNVVKEVIVCFIENTALRNAEHKIQLSEERLQLVFKGSTDAHWDWTVKNNHFYFSPRCYEMLGYMPEELEINNNIWTELAHADDLEIVQDIFYTHKYNGINTFEVEFRLQHKQGYYVDILCRGFLSTDVNGAITRVTGTNMDLSERKRAEREINKLVYSDVLTDLPNRRALIEHIQLRQKIAARTGHYQGLLFIDIDHFKSINDRFGHSAGDDLLRQVAERIRISVRDSDFPARLSGDEFVIFIGELSSDDSHAAHDIEHVGQKVLNALNEKFLIQGKTIKNTSSIGAYLIGKDENDVDNMLRKADLAMYQSKISGRGTIRFFDEKMQALVDERSDLEQCLREAIECSELILYLQPQTDANGSVVGAEALVRWNHPKRGLLGPLAFIELAEETRLIIPMGRWILNESCRILTSWGKSAATSHLTLAVNVSAVQLNHAKFADDVLGALVASGADATRLKLELTESVLATDIDEVIEKMKILKGHGVTFSLDDFGTGYSSLSYLKKLPIDQIKIDRSFVQDVLINATEGSLAETIILLGHKFNLSVVAEGVETEYQRAILAEKGCDLFQGYLFSKPLAINHFLEFVHKH